MGGDMVSCLRMPIYEALAIHPENSVSFTIPHCAATSINLVKNTTK